MSETAVADPTEEPLTQTLPDGNAGDMPAGDAASPPPVETPSAPDPALEADQKEALSKRRSQRKETSEQKAPEAQRRGVDSEAVRRANLTHLDNYQKRQTAIDAYDAELEGEGVSQALRKRLVGEFKGHLNAEHADGKTYGGYSAVEELQTAQAQAFQAAIDETFPSKELATEVRGELKSLSEAKGGFLSWGDAFKTVHTRGDKAGYERGYDEGHEAGFSDGQARAERNGRTEGGRAVNGTSPAAGGVPTIDQWTSMTLEQREAARRKDPQIEAKMMQAGV